MWAVLAVGAAGSAALVVAAACAVAAHPAAAARVLAVHLVWAFAVATVREIREARQSPKGLGSWRVACGAPPIGLAPLGAIS